MKKRFLIASLVVVGIVGLSGGIVLANRSTPSLKPVSNTVTQPPISTPVTAQQTTAPVVQTQTVAPSEAPAPTQGPTADETKAQVRQMIQDFMVSKGADLNTAQDNIDLQARCLGQMMTSNGISLDNNGATVDFINTYFINGVVDGSGVRDRILFDGPCHAIYIPVN